MIAAPAEPMDHVGAPAPDIPLIEIKSLSISFRTARRQLPVIRDFDLTIRRGEVVALVGESGSGKSTIGHSIMGLLPKENGTEVAGAINFLTKGNRILDLSSLPERRMRQLRGNDVAMIFQEPMSSLNPIYTIGSQIEEAICTHRATSRRAAKQETLDILAALGLPNPRKVQASYPHEISGGMRQRAMIAIALCCKPSLLIADEPTTALDVTVQAQIIDLLKQQQVATGMSLLFITHDLGVVSEISDRVTVLYAGQAVESAPLRSLFGEPSMPYTKALFRSMPTLGSSLIEGYELRPIPGTAVTPQDYDDGCSFRWRCEHRIDSICSKAQTLRQRTADHAVRCARWAEIGAGSS
jgi:oligopeptide/dipeptide ABC transporter ATP-binding protein